MRENYLGGETKGIEDTMRDLRDEIERCAQFEAEVDRLKAENATLVARVESLLKLNQENVAIYQRSVGIADLIVNLGLGKYRWDGFRLTSV